MNLNIIFLLLAAICASAQPTCPPINFLNARTINLNPTPLSHLMLLRQSDGSYTAFEMANASPYAILRTIPHFEQQFSNCLSRANSQASGNASLPQPHAQAAVAQRAAFAVLDSGNYLFVSPAPRSDSLDVAVFDQHLQLVSENHISALPPGSTYLSLLLADVNGDGEFDLIAQYAAAQGGGVSIFLGNGSGGFQTAGGFPVVGFVNGSMAVGDLNSDGKPDIVVGAPPEDSFEGGAGSIILALGKGDGTFVPTVLSTPNEAGPAAIAIADLNGDGKNDLIFLTCPLTARLRFTPNEVVVMLGKGDATFGSEAVFPVSVAAPQSVFDPFGPQGAIAVVDMNSDGIPDIVTNGITILLGDGKGGFPTRKDFLNTDVDSVILSDFDGDGKMDVLIGVGNTLVLSQSLAGGVGTLTAFFGDGSGGLAAAPQALSPNPTPQRSSPSNLHGLAPDIAMTSGDFNKDGIADLAYVSDLQYLSVFLGSASGAVTPTFTYDFAAVDQQAFPSSVVAADFNHDGILDLAVTVARSASPGSIVVFLSKGDGAFLPPVSSDAPASVGSLVTGDFNKDGYADLATINTNASVGEDEVVVFLGKGDGTFAPPQTYPAGAGASSLAAGDFNHDGIEDIAIANQAGINLLLSKPNGTFSSGAAIPLSGGAVSASLVAADLNKDGKLDLVAGLLNGGLAILFGHGDGTFGEPVIYPNLPGFSPDAGLFPSVAVGDINGDGLPDMFVNDASLLIGNGDGTFQLQTTNLPGLFGPVIMADFNGDGKLDAASGLVVIGNAPLVPNFPVRRGPAIFFNLSHPAALLNVVSAADFSPGPISPHSIASAFGKHLALSTASATPPSLPTTLGGVSVSVQDQTGAEGQGEIYYASSGQVNFVLPAGLEAGTAIVTVKTTDGQSASTEIQIASAPKIFLVDPSGIPAGYAVRVGPDNVQTIEPIFTDQGGHIQEVPVDLSTGDVYLILFGTGFDVPLSVEGSIGVQGGTVNFTATYAGPQPQFPGLDQINILLPKSLAGNGQSSLFLNTFQQTPYITIK